MRLRAFAVMVLVALLASASLSSCGGCSRGQEGGGAEPLQEGVGQSVEAQVCGDVEVKYAEGFTIKSLNGEDSGGVKLVEITDPSVEGSAVYRYALVARGAAVAEGAVPDGYEVIEVPVRRAICMTTLQLSPFIKLGRSDRVVGVTSTRFLHSEELNSRLRSGSLSRIGIEGEFDAEVVLSLQPDLIFVSPFKRGGYDSVKDLGIPMLTYLGYKELSALGQAEWIKLVGLLLGDFAGAEQLFAEVEGRYLSLLSLTRDVERRPRVLSGELHSGGWYVVGGRSALAQQFRDAGAEYFLDSDSASGGYYIDFESVYARGHDVDFWRVVNSFDGEYSYGHLLASDRRYGDFKAFRGRGVLYCNLRRTPFYENTPMEPDVVLADLIAIFHPDLLPDHRAVYYGRLQE